MEKIKRKKYKIIYWRQFFICVISIFIASGQMKFLHFSFSRGIFMSMLQAISLAKNIFIQCDSLSILFNRMLANEILKLLNFLSVNLKEKEKQNQKDIAYIIVR